MLNISLEFLFTLTKTYGDQRCWHLVNPLRERKNSTEEIYVLQQDNTVWGEKNTYVPKKTVLSPI